MEIAAPYRLWDRHEFTALLLHLYPPLFRRFLDSLDSNASSSRNRENSASSDDRGRGSEAIGTTEKQRDDIPPPAGHRGPPARNEIVFDVGESGRLDGRPRRDCAASQASFPYCSTAEAEAVGGGLAGSSRGAQAHNNAERKDLCKYQALWTKDPHSFERLTSSPSPSSRLGSTPSGGRHHRRHRRLRPPRRGKGDEGQRRGRGLRAHGRVSHPAAPRFAPHCTHLI